MCGLRRPQTGGVYPGAAKIARSPRALPLHVATEVIPLSESTAAALSARLALVFTGRPRLARHLLVEVIRQWWSGSSAVARTVDDLVSSAEACAAALARGDLPQVGRCLARYHGHKRAMAGTGYEPPGISEVLQRVEPLVWGACMCGAGGGGFLVLLSRESLDEPTHWEALSQAVGHGLMLHRAGLHARGLEIDMSCS